LGGSWKEGTVVRKEGEWKVIRCMCGCTCTHMKYATDSVKIENIASCHQYIIEDYMSKLPAAA